MKRFIATLLVSLALVLPAIAQEATVTVDSHQNNQSSVYFTVSNTTAGTVCVFPYVAASNNVYGSVVPMIQLEAGEGNINIGAYAQQNQEYAWSVQVSAKWRSGTCA